MVVDSILTPRVALLVHPSGNVYHIVNLQGHKCDANESNPDYL